jgi:hypothetical protein
VVPGLRLAPVQHRELFRSSRQQQRSTRALIIAHGSSGFSDFMHRLITLVPGLVAVASRAWVPPVHVEPPGQLAIPSNTDQQAP